MLRPIKLFFSYSHQDETLRDELAKRLSTLRRNRVISDWHDRQIGAGENWAQAIKDNLKSADIILLLVSPDFLHSEFCNEVELRQAMERHAAGEACVIPIILRSCYWQDEPFAALQALPKNAKPIKSWSDLDEAFLDVEMGIRSAIKRLKEIQQEIAANDGQVSEITAQKIENGGAIVENSGRKIENSGAIAKLTAQKIENSGVIAEISPQKIENSGQIIETLELQTFRFEVITVNDRGEKIDRRPGQANYFREELALSVFLDMVSIPGGTFRMGDSQKQVTIEPFFMGKFAVTQAQWRAIAKLPKINRDLKPDPSGFKGDNRPVEQVSWEDAIEFCDRLNRKTGEQYRLPSEAEWEYACRAGTSTPFHFGETITSALVNCDATKTYAKEPKGKYRKQTIEVGSLPPNSFGLYEMHGNVWEWCSDQENDYQIMRGGSWNYDPRNCRSAIRNRYRRDNFDNRWGFRLALFRPRTS